MAEVPINTDVPGSVTLPGSPPEPKSPAVADDSATTKTGYDHRIAQLVAERERAKQTAEKLQADYDALKAKTQTAEEKAVADAQARAVDQFKATEFEPVQQRLTQLTEQLRGQLDVAKATLTEDQIKKIPPGLPVEHELAFVQVMVGESPKQPSRVGGAINPVNDDINTRMVPWVEFEEWQRKASSMDATVRAEYKRDREKYQAAYREGRVERSR